MKTTLDIDDELIQKASQVTGVSEIPALVQLGLEALIAREGSRRLAKLGGAEKELKLPRRRKQG